MTAEITAKPKTTDREDIAKRLLRGSAKASFDPLVEIDWDAPVDQDMWAIRPERLSLDPFTGEPVGWRDAGPGRAELRCGDRARFEVRLPQ